MKMTPERIKRLKEAVKLTGETQEKVSEMLFESPSGLADLYEGKITHLPKPAKYILDKVYKINPGWVSSGKGDMRWGIDFNTTDSNGHELLDLYGQMSPMKRLMVRGLLHLLGCVQTTIQRLFKKLKDKSKDLKKQPLKNHSKQ